MTGRDKLPRHWLAYSLALFFWAIAPLANSGEFGIEVKPAVGTIDGEIFQTLIVMHALKDLGFDVQDLRKMSLASAHKAIASGEVTFIANHWQPLHDGFYSDAGGDTALSRHGVLVSETTQGYLIDKKTADRFKITRIDQLKNAKIAAVFDTDGDGKANLVGCEKTWGCAAVIKQHLASYGLRQTINNQQADYRKDVNNSITRVRSEQSALFYAWTPYWVTSKVVPGTDVIWLEVPFSALPPPRDKQDTRRKDGRNLGFALNTQKIVASRQFVEKYPRAERLFELIRIPAADISAQNRRMQVGEDSRPDIERHARQWINNNRATYDSWITAARKSAPK